MVKQQPEALRLADALEDDLTGYDGLSIPGFCQNIANEAAVELRRLEEENLRLREEKNYFLHKAGENIAEIAELQAENAELKDDAGRYRWLRETRFIHSDFSYIAHNGKKVVGLEFGWFPAPDDKIPTREDLDNAIDLERRAK